MSFLETIHHYDQPVEIYRALDDHLQELTRAGMTTTQRSLHFENNEERTDWVIRTDTATRCKVCHGRGSYTAHVYWHNHPTTKEIPCESCYGSGYEETYNGDEMFNEGES